MRPHSFHRHRIITKGIVGGIAFVLTLLVLIHFFGTKSPKQQPTDDPIYIAPGGNLPEPVPLATGDTSPLPQTEDSGNTTPSTPDTATGSDLPSSGTGIQPTQPLQTPKQDADDVIQNIIKHLDTQGETAGARSSTLHSSASQTFSYDDYRTLCAGYKAICNKIEYRGRITPHQQVLTLGYAIHLFFFLEKNLTQGDFLDSLSKLAIDGGTGRRRGLSSHTKTILYLGSMRTDREIREVLTHEIGHIVDLGVLRGSSSRLHQGYTEFGKVVFGIDDPSFGFYELSRRSESTRHASSASKDFASGYGMTNPFEDFAEGFNLYINHNDLFEKYTTDIQMKKKKQFFDTLLGGAYLHAASASYAKPRNIRHRDTTKIGGR